MRIIIPMAGLGKRMRPHTLTIPKPLIPVAGKPMVQRIVEDLAKISPEKITEIAFVTGRFGKETEDNLVKIANNLGAEGKVYYQDEPHGIAHAILCAKDSLREKLFIAFADTLFIPDLKSKVDLDKDGIIWVQRIDDPRQFGVVKLDKNGYIADFAEKPDTYISDLAIIGIYYFKDGEKLKDEIQNLIDKDIRHRGEYQLTSVLENMKKKGTKFSISHVKEWLDCGNKDATVFSNRRILETYYSRNGGGISSKAEMKNSKIIPPCFIGENVKIIDSTVGPYASVGDNTVIEKSIIESSIIQTNSKIKNAMLSNSMLGNYVVFSGNSSGASLGDYSVFKNRE